MADKPKGRSPDWDFRALNKHTDEKSKVGVAWSNQDGSIRLKLNPFTVLTAGPDLVLTLFKDTGNYHGKARTTEAEDEIPF